MAPFDGWIKWCIDISNVHENENGSLSAGGEAFRQANNLKGDFYETSSRLRNLEEELARMRINLQASLRKNSVYDMDDTRLSYNHEFKEYIAVAEATEISPQPAGSYLKYQFLWISNKRCKNLT